MALPSLNNKTTIGNLSLDDKASIISSLVHSGKLQLANYGAINFNQTVNAETGTATKEGGESFGGQAIANALSQIRNSISSLSATITNFLQSSMTEKQVAENFAEAIPKDIKTDTEDKIVVGFGGVNQTLTRILEKIDGSNIGTKEEGGGIGSLISSGFSKLISFFGSDGFGKIFSGILKFLVPALGILGRSIPYLAAGYVLSKLPGLAETGKQMLSEGGGVEGKLKELSGMAENQMSKTFSDLTGGTTSIQTGTTSTQTVTSQEAGTNGRLVQTAEKFEGMTEKTNKAELNKFLKTNLGDNFGVSEAWCASFVNAVLASNGFKKSSNPKSAKSFLRYGEKVQLNNAKPGDIVIFNRGSNANQGHVGLFVSLNGNMITIIGGNQGQKGGGGVTKSTRRIDKKGHELVDIRRPTENEREKSFKEPALPNENTSSAIPEQNTTTTELSQINEQQTAIQEQGTKQLPEYEDEQEETSEKVYTDPSVKKLEQRQTATKEDTGQKGSAQEAFNFFKSKGWTEEQAAGIVGNLQYESGLDPTKKQIGGGPGFGIAQWEPPRQKMFKQVFGKELKKSSFEEQLEFVNWELNNTHKKASKELQKATTAKEATLAVRAFYETPGGNNNPKTPHGSDNQRIKLAESVSGTSSQETEYASSESGQAAKPSEQQEPSIAEKISSFVKDLGSDENIRSMFTSGVGEAMELVGGALGFDTSRLNLPKNRKPQEEKGAAAKPKEIEPEQEESELDKKMADDFFGVDKSSSSLEMKKTEESKKLEIARQELSQAKEIKLRKESTPQQQQQPIVVNNTTKGGDSSPINPGVPNALETRDSTPAIQDLLYKALKSAFS